MLTKKETKDNFKNCRREFGDQLTKLRKNKQMSLEELHVETGIPINYLEKTELGLFDFRISVLLPIARFFNKKIKIELVD